MDKKSLLLYLLGIMLLLVSCQTQTASTEVVDKATAPPEPSLEAEKGGVKGQVFSTITNGPLANITVRLAEVVRQDEQAAFVLDTAFSPGAVTDENGNFEMLNVPAMEYILVVGNVEVYQGYKILQDTSGQAFTYEVKAGEILDVGKIEVALTGDEN